MSISRVGLAAGSPPRAAAGMPCGRRTASRLRSPLQVGSTRRSRAPEEPARHGRLWTSDVPVYPSDWSRDGQYLAYTESRTDTSNDIWLLPMTGERKPMPLLRSPFTEFHAQFSPDGRWLAFTSNESGRDDVYVQSLFDAGTRRLVSSGGGGYPRWGPDGRESVLSGRGWSIDDRARSDGRLVGGAGHARRDSAAGGSTWRASVSVRRRAGRAHPGADPSDRRALRS